MPKQICPSCGCHLQQFESFAFGNVTIDDCGKLIFEGQHLDLPKCQYLIVDALVRAKGRGLTRSVLANAIGNDINDETISKYIQRVRSSFQTVEPAFCQIVSLNGFGAYRWQFRKAAQADTMYPAAAPQRLGRIH